MKDQPLFDPRSDAAWIVIPNWAGPKGFQHYKDRTPKWIKNYTELMADDAYLSLSLAERGFLHGLWLEYAQSRGNIRATTNLLSRRLGATVYQRYIDSLYHAGFITFSASKPVSEPEQDRSLDQIREVHRTTDVDVTRNGHSPTGAADLTVDLELGRARLLHAAPLIDLRMLADFELPAAAWHAAAEAIEEQHPVEPEKYAYTCFKDWARSGRYAFKGPEPE
jgi:hypothetical protein